MVLIKRTIILFVDKRTLDTNRNKHLHARIMLAKTKDVHCKCISLYSVVMLEFMLMNKELILFQYLKISLD